MKASQFTDAQKAFIIKQGEDGTPIAEICRKAGISQATPHIAQCITAHRGSNLDRRTTRHEGYGLSQPARKRIEEAFGWMKTIAGQRRTRLRGIDRVGWSFTLAAAAYNLIRLPRLLQAPR